MKAIKVDEMTKMSPSEVTKNDLLMVVDAETNQSRQLSVGSFLESKLVQSIGEKDLSDYTAFEVFPTNKVIPANTIDNIESLASLFSWTEDDKERMTISGVKFTELTYTEDVPSSMTACYSFYSLAKKSELDIVIDWGDGTINKVSDFDSNITEYDDNTCISLMYHTYSKSGKYITKIYGSKYNRVRNNANSTYGPVPLISRLMDNDLPIASCVQNISSLCLENKRLLQLIIPSYFDAKSLTNIFTTFAGATNLLKVEVDPTSNINNNSYISASGTFRNCVNLESSNFRLPLVVNNPKNSDNLSSFYYGCSSLSSDINDLIPTTGFSTGSVVFSSVFNGCSSLTGDVNFTGDANYKKPSVADILWNSTNTNYVGYDYAFKNSGIKDQVPTSWGGTLSLREEVDLNSLKIEGYNIFEVDTTPTEFTDDNGEVLSTITFAELDSNGNIIIIDWGDGNKELINSRAVDLTHTYIGAGKFTISINDALTKIKYSSATTNTPTKPSELTSYLNSQTLLSIYLNSVTELSTGAFKYCDKLTTAYLSPKLVTYGGNVFYQCKKLADVTMCNQSSDLTISNDFRLFYGCTDLPYSILTNKFTGIGPLIYYNCNKITKVIIPNSVKHIKAEAFRGMNNCLEYNFKSFTEVPKLDISFNSAGRMLSNFGSVNVNLPYIKNSNGEIIKDDSIIVTINYRIKVPENLLEAWKSTNNWKYYADYIES